MTRYILSILLTLLFAQAGAQYAKIKTQKSPSGIPYKFFKANKGPRIVAGDEIYFKLKGSLSDSMIFDSYRNTRAPFMTFTCNDNYKKRSFEDALCLMTTGDSAVFLINADTFFSTYMGDKTPAFAKPGDPIYFFVKIDSVASKAVVAARKAAKDKEMADRKNNESTYLTDYIKSTGLQFTRTASGLYYIVTRATVGKKADNGDKISALYTGKLLNGQVFDSNQDSGQPFEFTLGAHMVIAGWDEIFSILHEGETATIVLPSSLAYGPSGAGESIPPYSPLIFDVVFVKATKGQ